MIRNDPTGAKGAGQGPLLPVRPAVANAVFYDAIGVRIHEVADHAWIKFCAPSTAG